MTFDGSYFGAGLGLVLIGWLAGELVGFALGIVRKIGRG
jgi:hypothetical protein